MSMGARIAEARKAKGFTQEYIAEKLNVSRQAVSKWEKDISSPDTKNLIALAELLCVSVDYLAAGKTREVPEMASAAASLAWGFRIGSLICLIVAAVCWCVGLFSGEYTDMVQIPISSGMRMGIPLLMYGESPAAIGLLLISIVSLILMILFLILGNAAEKK